MDKDQAITLLIFQVGPYSFSVSALEVESIISSPPITTIPFAPKSVVGTCLFHEKVALVISLHQKFGLTRNADNATGQLIVTQLESSLAAFWVDAVHDVTTLTDLQLEKISAAQSSSVFDRFLLKDGQVILHTSFETLYNLPDAAYVDNALKTLASLGKKPETGEQKNIMETVLQGTAENTQTQNDQTINATGSAGDKIAKSSPQSSSLDIFDFETVPPSQGDLTGPSPGSINYSIDEHDVFDTNNVHKITKNSHSRSREQENSFTKHRRENGVLPKEKSGTPINPPTHDHFVAKKTGSSYQDISGGLNPRRKSMTVWACLIALLLAFATAFFLWPPQPPEEKATYHKETYQVVAEKQQTKKEFRQTTKKYTPSKTIENRDATISPSLAEEDVIIEHETTAQKPTPYSTSTGKTGTIAQPPADAEGFSVEAAIVSEQPVGPEHLGQSNIKPGTFTEPKVVGAEDIVPEKKQEPSEGQNEKGEIYRVENKDFAIIVERPAKKELLIIDKAPKKKIIFQEYIHTVIKGDTLWSIAAKYLGNPFLYNKLADNSEIKNPNLIYPGDRVRIIKKHHNR